MESAKQAKVFKFHEVYPKIFRDWKIMAYPDAAKNIYVTEKIHGTNISLYIFAANYLVVSRNGYKCCWNADEWFENNYHEIINRIQHDYKNYLSCYSKAYVKLVGEFYGGGTKQTMVQNRITKMVPCDYDNENNRYAVFDISLKAGVRERIFEPYDRVAKFCETYGIRIAPLIKGPFHDMKDAYSWVTNDFCIEDVKSMASASSNHPIEGIVVRFDDGEQALFPYVKKTQDHIIGKDPMQDTTFSDYRPTDLQAANLFGLRKGAVTDGIRASVLDGAIEYQAYATALYILIEDWLDHKNQAPDKRDTPDMRYIRNVNQKLNCRDKNADLDAENVCDAREKLMILNVPGHLEIVTSHRRWIQDTFNLLKRFGVPFESKMSERVRLHDLSKYGHKEVLGYSIMFGDRGGFKQLGDEDEKMEWELSLRSHYAHNPHHPEYFYPVIDGVKTNSVYESEGGGRLFLDESIINVLACRGERVLAADKVISIKNWFDIPDRYLARYNEKDKTYVKERLAEFSHKAADYLSDKFKRMAVQELGIFGTHGYGKKRIIF